MNAAEAFGADLLRWIIDKAEDFFTWEESESICEVLQRHGLVEYVAYDPERHGHIEDAEPGDIVWHFTEEMARAAEPNTLGSSPVEDERAFEVEFATYCTPLTRPKLSETHREFGRRIARHHWLAALAHARRSVQPERSWLDVERIAERLAEELGGVALIAAERMRQIEVEGWTPEHDDEHVSSELLRAAQCYVWAARQASLLRSERMPMDAPLYDNLGSREWPVAPWPWAWSWWRPSDDPIRNLVKAGALIVAEIDRLRRKQLAAEPVAQPGAPAFAAAADNLPASDDKIES